jgi:hypothetical protein
MRLNRAWCVIVGLAAVAGCSRQPADPCVPEARYSTARSVAPVQIPDDLSPPDESDAIRLPADFAPAASIKAGECVEKPPSFFGESRPFSTGEEESRKARREARREAKREARAAAAGESGAAPAAEPDAAPAESNAPAPADGDRTIDN